MNNITLYFREGGSDKVYQAAIMPERGGFVVNFAYGRRGTTLQTGIKTQSPVPHDEARHIYDQLVKSKMAKGYTPGESGTPYSDTPKEARATGVSCQLLNPVDEDAAKALIPSPAYFLQEKKDGRRRLVSHNGEVIGINRKGLEVALPVPMVEFARRMPAFLVDGEIVGDILYAFDVLELEGQDLRPFPYRERLDALKSLNLMGPMRPVETMRTPDEKKRAFSLLRMWNAEGVVFKEHHAPYTGGRPNSGGPQLKCKFTATASLIVAGVNRRRSVSLALANGIEAGNVTIPANHAVPKAGDIVEVRYLYAFRESGRLFQPCYLGPRDDIEASACTAAQLKYRAPVEEDDS